METNLVEVFSSIQGEGTLVGLRQVFIRFAGCNLACRYCDTPESSGIQEFFRVEKTPGRGDFVNLPNPVTPVALMEVLAEYDLSPVHSISLTGGEPLLHKDFLAEFLPLFRDRWPLKVYLETNGVLSDALTQVIGNLDIVGMDIKLPGTAGGQGYWQEHLEFLKTAAVKEVFVKIVVSERATTEELTQAFNLVKEVNPGIPVILQPLTAKDSHADKAPEGAALIDLQDLALKFLRDVRVIPQTHKFIGQL